jgi:hypothetical protein
MTPLYTPLFDCIAPPMPCAPTVLRGIPPPPTAASAVLRSIPPSPDLRLRNSSPYTCAPANPNLTLYTPTLNPNY